MRKLFIGIGLLLIIGFFVIIYLAYVRPASEQSSPYEAVGRETPVIIEMNSLNSVTKQFKELPYWQEVQKTGLVSKLNTQIDVLGQLLTKKTEFASLFTESNLLAAVHLTQATDFDYLYILKRTVFNRLRSVDVGQYLKDQGYTFEQRTFKNTPIYEIDLENKEISIVYKNGLLLASFSPFLVEDAIVQVESSHSVQQDTAFTKLQGVAKSKSSTKIYLNCNHMDILSPLLVQPPYEFLFQRLANFTDWIELDLVTRKEGLLFNGYSYSTYGQAKLDDVKNIPPQDVKLMNFVPSQTAFLFYYGVNRYQQYSLQANLDTTNNFFPYFSSWIGGEWAFGVNKRIGYSIRERSYCIVRTTNPETSRKSLSEIARLTGDSTKVDSFYNFPIGRITKDSLLNNLFAHSYLPIPQPYYTVFDDVVIFSSSLENLKTILQNLISEKVLTKNMQYLDFREQLSSRTNFYVYMNARKMAATLEDVLSQPLAKNLTNSDQFNDFSPYALQFSNFNQFFFTNGFIRYNPDYDRQTNELWACELDTTTHFKPEPVKNHTNNKWEFLVQDVANTVYLINNSGKILWKRKLDEKILGNVEQMDFYNNGKLQYVFTTRRKIYILDRLGRDVANYPLKLTAPAVTGLQLVEYEKRGVYRIFVGCENGNIYGYERGGKPLPGWSPKENVGVMNAPLYYFVIQNDDYLVATNRSGELHYFDRAGNLRTEDVVRFDTATFMPEPFTVHIEEDDFAFIGHDTTGKVYHAYRDGSTKVIDTAHSQSAFSIKARDIDGDQTVEYVFVDSSRVRVYENDFSMKFTYIFPGKVDEPVFFVPGASTSGNVPIGVLSRKENKIYLLHPNGKPFQDFPLEGNTAFHVQTILSENEKVLVTGNGRGKLIAYRLIE